MTLKKKIRTRNGRFLYACRRRVRIMFLLMRREKNVFLLRIRNERKSKYFQDFCIEIRSDVIYLKMFLLESLACYTLLRDVVCSCIAAETDFLQLEVYGVAQGNKKFSLTI